MRVFPAFLLRLVWVPLVFVSVSLVWAPVAWGQSSVWEVSNGKHQVLIGGTVHLLSKEDYPLPREFERAFLIADKVYFETDIGVISRPEFGIKIMQRMMFTDGRNLRTVLSPEVWKALEAFAAERGLPVASLLMFKPGFAGMTLTILEAQRLGLGQGVDAYYHSRARQSGKPTGFLETPDQQITLLETLNKVDPDELILSVLSELETLPEMFKDAVKAWRAGDMAALDKQMGEPLRAQSPELYQVLLVARNRDWLRQVETMLETPELEYVLVGALHLAGPDNLLALLRAKGYEVKPYTP